MSLATDTRVLVETVNAIDQAVRDADYDDVDQGLICRQMLAGAARDLSVTLRKLDDDLGVRMGARHYVVEGVGQFSRFPRRDGATRCIDEEGLWRLVCDTRLVDPATGEVIPQHEVIRRVYGSESRETGRVRLTGATPTKAEAAGIDPELFFEKAPLVGWTIRCDA